MTRIDVIEKALSGAISWEQAAKLCRVTTRQMRRLRARYEAEGPEGLRDNRNGKHQPCSIPEKIVRRVCRLKEARYADFSIQHFHQFLREEHGIQVSYSWTRETLIAHGLAYRAEGRGKYRRRRPRRPMTGMMLHLDASTHCWIQGLPYQDLVVVLDDADGRILYARFFREESTLSTLAALKHVLKEYGRFCELYTDRASHFCRTKVAGDRPAREQDGVVPRALNALGIRQIWANSPQARGRSERAFGTLQGRLPQELRLRRIRTYAAANNYLVEHFVPRFNAQFTVVPAQSETAFIELGDVDLELLLSVTHERIARADNTVSFQRLILQIPPTDYRMHFARCRVKVHEFPDETIGISHEGHLLATYDRDAELVRRLPRQKRMHCKEHPRVVRADNAVFFKNLVLPIPASAHGDDFRGCQVLVEEYRDGTIDITHDGYVIGRFHKSSNRLELRHQGSAA